MKIKMILGCLLFTSNNLNAQSLTPFVIASGGNIFSTPSVSLSYTIGEMAMVETYSKSNNILTQGFQQPPPNLATAINPQGFPGLSIKIFPNPSTGKLFVSLIAPYTITISGSLYDATGRKVSTFHIHQSSGQQNYEYNWNNLNSGVYIMELFLKNQTATIYEKVTHKIFITH
jgi:hypothetical protein